MIDGQHASGFIGGVFAWGGEALFIERGATSHGVTTATSEDFMRNERRVTVNGQEVFTEAIVNGDDEVAL